MPKSQLPKPVYESTRHCRLCKTVMSVGEGAIGQIGFAFGRPVTGLCCPDCLNGYSPPSYAVVQPRKGRRKTVPTTEYYKPVDLAALPIGKRGRRFDPRPRLTLATAVRIGREYQTQSALLPNYKPPSRFRVA